MLKAYRIYAQVSPDRHLTLDNVPFDPGEEVEIIVHAAEPRESDAGRYSLRGEPLRYSNPTGELEPAKVGPDTLKRSACPASAKGLFVVPDDFDAPLDDITG